ncbi:MAG: hypothetical protein R2745_26040 [Vicinamibacterales bacterium]
MARRRFRLSAGLAALGLAAACSQNPAGPTTPSAAAGSDTTANADGSTLKISAPTPRSPVGGERLTTARPTFSFDAATGRYAAASPSYRIEVFTSDGALLGARDLPAGTTSYVADTDLGLNETFLWRVRAELDGAVGPWSATESFLTPAPAVFTPPPGSGSGGTLPFPIPAACGPGDPSNRFACVSAMARLSAEWAACARGIGIGCHRFTRQVVYALAQSDPGYQLIQAQPGGHACNCSACGPSDGTMLREDTTVYRGNRVYDMITGAGGSSPGLTWSSVPGPRPGDIPKDAVLCQ